MLQPGYLPWLGFFEQLSTCDLFVIYDDVQFDKNGWRNRNRIKSPAGPHWLTVPVHAGIDKKILEVTIDNKQNWTKKHIGSIEQFYKKCDYLDCYLPRLKELLANDWQYLIDLDMQLLMQMKEWLGIGTSIVRSSELGVDGDRNLRLLNMCKHFKATSYYSGKAAQCYLDVDLFAANQIEVIWQEYAHPEYRQLHGQFVPYLSALDLLLNCGPDSKKFFAK